MDEWLFFSLNQWAGWGYPSDYLAWFLAVWGLGILGLLLLLRWVFPGPDPRRDRHTVLLAVTAAVLTLGVAQLSGIFFYRVRPYAALPHAFDLLGGGPASSFPSEHAAVAFSLACVMGWESRLWGGLSWLTALGVAWGRVYAGVHYPTDMLGSLVLSFLSTCLLVALRTELEPALDRVLSWLPRSRAGVTDR